MDNKLRIAEKNTTNCRIRELQKCIETNDNTIRYLRGQQKIADSKYISVQLSIMENKSNKYNVELESLYQKLDDITSGALDDELMLKYNKHKSEYDIKNRISRQNKLDEKEIRKQLSTVSISYYKNIISADRKSRRTTKSFKWCYRHYLKAINSVPAYMKRNLKSMPNNKGYFWKGVALYGKLPYQENKSKYLFDRKRGGIQVIHEWTNDKYKIYHKKRHKKQELYETRPRKQK